MPSNAFGAQFTPQRTFRNHPRWRFSNSCRRYQTGKGAAVRHQREARLIFTKGKSFIDRIAKEGFFVK